MEEGIDLLDLLCVCFSLGLCVDDGLAMPIDLHAWLELGAVGIVYSVTVGVVRCENLCAGSRGQIHYFLRQKRLWYGVTAGGRTALEDLPTCVWLGLRRFGFLVTGFYLRRDNRMVG
jgi:hypothetical protein